MSELPYEGDDAFVYVSYAREDEDKCLKFIEHLDSLGYRVYYTDDIEVEQDKIQAATSVLFFVTDGSSESEEVKLELQYASSSAKDGVAVHLEECQVSGTVGLLLGQFDELKRYRMKEAFYRKRLKKSLDSRTVRDGATPPPVVEMEFEAPTPKPLPKIKAPPPAAVAAPPPKPKEDDLVAHVAEFEASQSGSPRPKAKPKAKKGEASVGLPSTEEISKTVKEKVEEFKKLETPQKVIFGGAALLALFILIGLPYLMIASPSGPPDSGGTGVDVGDGQDEGPPMTPEQRAAQAKALAAELEKRRLEREEIRAEREQRERLEQAIARGKGLARERKYDAALKELTAALKLDPGNVDVLLARADAFFQARKDDEAVADYSQVLEKDPGNIQAHFERGNVLKFKKPKEAVSDFTAVLKVEPKRIEAWIARADAKRKVGSKNYLKSAVKDYSYSIKLSPTHAAYYGRSLCYKKLGDAKRYHRDQEKARTLKP